MTDLNDFNNLILEHYRWKGKMEEYLENDGNALTDYDLLKDYHACALGQWIDANSESAISGEEVFQQLVEHHKQFHMLADQIYLLVQQGNKAEIEKEKYYEISDKLFEAMEQIQVLQNNGTT